MKRKLRALIVALLLLALGYVVGWKLPPVPDAGGIAGAPTADEAAEPTVWTCSMHPNIRLPEPVPCPICFMDLIPVERGDGGGLGPTAIAMSPAAVGLAAIETAPVERRLVSREVRMVGRIAYDETRVSYITAWVAGRLDRLFVDYTGVTVREGDALVEVYSPELFSAQRELLQAIETERRLESSSVSSVKESSARTVVAARERLRRFGLTAGQIEELIASGAADERVTMHSPSGGVVVQKSALVGMYVKEGTQIYTIVDLSRVWVLLEAYESDLAWLRYGQDVALQVEAYPGETFHGRVAFIDPVLDDRTRTVSVRLSVENSGSRLKPDMFVSAVAKAPLAADGRVVDESLEGLWICPRHPEVLADGPTACTACGLDLVATAELGFAAREGVEPPLVIPTTAPLVTGKRAVVYVEVPDTEEPTFEGRDVVLGPRAGDWYVVREGLEEGQRVVVNGNFKIDSELQLRAQPSMMSSARDEPALEGADAPESFRKQLGSIAVAYLAAHEALAADDDETAATALGGVAKALERKLVDEWTDALEPLTKAVKAASEADDLAARRLAFVDVSVELIRALDRHGYLTEGDELAVFHCPMYLDGVDWVQATPEVVNPYYGSAMFRCGTRTRVLARGN